MSSTTGTSMSLMSILGYNTWLFGNALKDVGTDQFTYRVNEKTNKFDRIAGHITVARYGLAQMAQIEAPVPSWGSFGEFGMGVQFQEDHACPPIPEIGQKFQAITEILMAKLPEAPDSLLSAPATLPIPGENPTMLEQLAFMTMHETYHIGQLSILKKSMSGVGLMDPGE